jgi:hypothetical protein
MRLCIETIPIRDAASALIDAHDAVLPHDTDQPDHRPAVYIERSCNVVIGDLAGWMLRQILTDALDVLTACASHS